MRAELRDLRFLTGSAAFPDIEGAALLAEVEDLAVFAEDRIPLLALEVAELCELPRSRLVLPDIAGDPRCVVLAPFVLVALVVVVDELRAVLADLKRQNGERQLEILVPAIY